MSTGDGETADQLPPDEARDLLGDVSRRRVLQGAGVLSGVAGIAAAGLAPNDHEGNLWGGTMALDQAYRLDPDGRQWIGPDSAKSNVDPNDGRLYVATDTEVEYYGDNNQWNLRSVGSSQKPVPSVTTEQGDIDAFTAGLSASGRGRITVPDTDGDKRTKGGANVIGQQHNSYNDNRSFIFLNSDGLTDLWMLDEEGTRNQLVDNGNGNGNFDAATVDIGGTFYTIQDGTAYVYTSESNLSSGTVAGSQSSVLPPYQFAFVPFWNSSETPDMGAMWAEYGSPDDVTEFRIMRAKEDGTISTAFTYADTDIRHFHTLDHDFHNQGTFYATTGDQGSDIRWVKSTDWGQNWSELSAPGGSQTYRTLRLAFTADYIYWATDGFESSDGFSKLYRAPRNDLGNPEELAQLSDVALSQGVSHDRAANLLFVSMRDTQSTGAVNVPQYCWDIEDEQLRELYTIPGDTSINSSPGIRQICYDDNIGRHFYTVVGYDGGVTTGRQSFSMQLQRLQQ